MPLACLSDVAVELDLTGRVDEAVLRNEANIEASLHQLIIRRIENATSAPTQALLIARDGTQLNGGC